MSLFLDYIRERWYSMSMDTQYEPLDWDLNERDRLLESGELTKEIPDPAQVAVGEDE